MVVFSPVVQVSIVILQLRTSPAVQASPRHSRLLSRSTRPPPGIPHPSRLWEEEKEQACRAPRCAKRYIVNIQKRGNLHPALIPQRARNRPHKTIGTRWSLFSTLMKMEPSPCSPYVAWMTCGFLDVSLR